MVGGSREIKTVIFRLFFCVFFIGHAVSGIVCCHDDQLDGCGVIADERFMIDKEWLLRYFKPCMSNKYYHNQES